MSETAANGTAPANGRWSFWRIVLFVSLALNLLAAGAIIAHLAFGPPPPDRIEGFSSMQILPRKFVSDLTGERRREVVSILRKYRGEFRERRTEMRAATERIAVALVAEPYDPMAVTAAIDEFASTGRLMIDGGVTTVKSVIVQLTPDERRLLAERIRERANRRKSPDRGRDRDN
jgi:hypothetical protein